MPDWTLEELEQLKQRILAPRQVEYKSAAGHRRVEQQDADKLLAAYREVKAEVTPGPTFRRAKHARGFGR